MGVSWMHNSVSFEPLPTIERDLTWACESPLMFETKPLELFIKCQVLQKKFEFSKTIPPPPGMSKEIHSS